MKKFAWLLPLVGMYLSFVVGCSSNPGEADPKGAATPVQQESMDKDVGKVPGA